MKLAASFLTAMLFGIGLGISGMTQPDKVIGFLDITSNNWDMSLAIVMMGAISVYSVAFWLITRRPKPVLAAKFQIPMGRDIDWRLIVGSVLFGLGWGIGGFCPAPALVVAVSGNSAVWVFLASLVTGVYLHKFVTGRHFMAYLRNFSKASR
jgi:uncharacterized membrane protein YedE/YeeE